MGIRGKYIVSRSSYDNNESYVESTARLHIPHLVDRRNIPCSNVFVFDLYDVVEILLSTISLCVATSVLCIWN